MSLISAAIILFMVMDPFGNIPFFISALKHVPEQRRPKVVARELLIALGVLLLFLGTGPHLLKLLAISEHSIRIAGGIILFMIAIRMVFGGADELFKNGIKEEPFIVPLAVPYIAGPSTIATILLFAGQEPGRWKDWIIAIVLAWFCSALILFFAVKISKVLGKRLLKAIEHLMGLILMAIAVEMLVNGIKTVFFAN